ncbi:MAG: cytochrome o ubiquinol oxidase subunit IV, partial [Spartobacteria bacterium]
LQLRLFGRFALMEKNKEFRHYLLGFVLATSLTVIPITHVATLGGKIACFALILCAILQLIVHLRYFLHLSFKGQQREDLQLVLFTGLILFIMIGGSIWVLGDLYNRM